MLAFTVSLASRQLEPIALGASETGMQTTSLRRNGILSQGFALTAGTATYDHPSQPDDRPGWRNLWRHLREGDTLVVLAIDRLGRNLVKVIQTVKTLEDRGVGLKVLSGLIDTTNPNGRLMLHIVAAMAQWERELIVERTKHGLKTAREQGRVGGAAKQVTDEQIEDARKQRSKGVSVATLSGKLGVSKTALYKRLNPPGKKEKAK